MLHFKKKKENKEYSKIEYYKTHNPLEYCKHVYIKEVVFNNANVIETAIDNVNTGTYFKIEFSGEEYVSDILITKYLDPEFKKGLGRYTLWSPKNKEYAKIIK